MTREEIKIELYNGSTIKHDADPYSVQIVDGLITSSDDFKYSQLVFWKNHSNKLYDNGWKVIKRVEPLSPWHTTYLNIANEIAQHSKDSDRKVGCVVVKDNRIISFGYNGTPHGWDNSCKDESGKTKPEVIHAESNAITKCAKSTESIAGATMYCTLAPCIECAKLIIQSEIKELYYQTTWKDSTGIYFLNKAGIKTWKV